jgi:hypothetical protein
LDMYMDHVWEVHKAVRFPHNDVFLGRVAQHLFRKEIINEDEWTVPERSEALTKIPARHISALMMLASTREKCG